MNVPTVENATEYVGLYIYDFGEWSALGYTAEEIAILLEDPATRHGTIYRISRATPDGGFEIRGVSAERFELEAGIFFFRAARDAADHDFSELRKLGEATPPPCRAVVRCIERPDASPEARYCTCLVYPAEYDEDISRWLLHTRYNGGDFVEGGIAALTDLQQQPQTALHKAQLWPQKSRVPRDAAEVLGSTRRAVQR